jgi:ligand-binding sensor domain-containing protein/signal transduction histidine kinase
LGVANLTRLLNPASEIFVKIHFPTAQPDFVCCAHLRSQLFKLMKRWALPIAWLALCVPVPVFAADGSASPFIVDVWDNEKGLPDNEVISVIQSHDGYLWLGTLHGLVRFDGNQFTIFNKHNTPGLNSDRIILLFEDSKTNLWVGTDNAGLSMIRNGVIRNFSSDVSGNNRKAMSADEDSSGDVWFNTTEGIFRYHSGETNFYPGPVRFAPGPIQNWQREKKYFGPFPWNRIQVKAACRDNAGNLVVGTLGAGIFWSDAKGNFQNISTNQGLSSVYVLSLCVDREGNLWVGTDGGGLNRVKKKIFTSPPGLHPWAAQSLSESTNGGLWVAFGALGATHWTTNSVEDFRFGTNQAAWEILVDRQQQVWAGTHNEGLFFLNSNDFQPAPGAEIPGKTIYALFESRVGQLWVGTQNGLARRDDQTWTNFTTHDGLSENVVRAIAEGAGGKLWVGTENRGLNYFQDGKFVPVTNALTGDDISCLYADMDGYLWVGTSGHGLGLLRDGKWASFSTENGLSSDSISYIVEDAGDLWVGSNAGLMRILKKSLEDFASGKTNSIFCRTYGKTDGLPTRECSAGSQPAVARAADGRLWFPTTKGVVSVNPTELKPNLQPPTVAIESVLVDGREQKTNQLTSSWRQFITVPPGAEELEIRYSALNFSAPELVRFKCWLEGHEARPTDVGGERIARYPKLPPGDYNFHVSACNEDGVWNEAGSVLEITVQPYFWQTTGFHISAIIVALAIVVAGVRYISTQKLHRQLQAHQQREALEHERARIARDLHDQLGANLTQVALLGEMAEADKHAPEEIESHAQQISTTARETTRSLDEIVWAINPANDTLEGLANYTFKYAQEFLALAGVRCRLDAPAQLPAISIPPEVRHNVFLAFKEAVNNVVKHAQAGEARIRLRFQPNHFIFEIEDNGKGVSDLTTKQDRNGLRNMRKRMENIGGNFEIAPAAGQGTIVRLTVPLERK